MSTQATRIDDQDGDEAVYILPYTEEIAQQSALSGVSTRTDSEPDSTTPDPVSGENEKGGIITRANEYMSSLGPTALEAVGLHGLEISKANAKRAGELYRNKFPLLTPRYSCKCEDCSAEFDKEKDVCDYCGCSDLKEPSAKQRTQAEKFFQQVNREGQSLRQLYKLLARDGGRLGIWLHIVKKTYTYWDKPTLEIGGETVIQRGQVYEDARELVRGDPKRIKPVVNEHGRIGDWWWACPVCEDRVGSMQREPGFCDEHGTELREVHYAEVEKVGDTEPEKVYFADEVVDYAPFEPRLAGKDALSPIDSLWLKQAILQWMDLYAGAFFDSEGDNRYPGKLLIVHTTNADGFERSIDEAQEDAKNNPNAQGIVYNEVPPGSDSVSEAQVIDMMSDEILGQSDQLKQDYKSDIRSRYGLVDAQDSELSDAGGLNNEGLQLTINDRDKATTLQDIMEGPLRKLMDSLGFTDWEIGFVPPERPEEETSTMETVQAAALANQNGIAYSIEDGRLELQDTDGVVDPDPTPDDDGGPGDGPPTDVQPPDATPNQEGGETDDVEEALNHLEGMQRSIVWDEDDGLKQQAGPMWSDSGDMPQFVKDLLKQALRSGAVWLGDYDAPNVTGQAVKRFFDEKLDQPSGWSRISLTKDFADRFNISKEDASDVIETQLTNVLNKAREIGYRNQSGDSDDVESSRRFKWIGPGSPDDGRTTDACVELKRETNPDYGGEAKTLDELEEMVGSVQEEYYPEFEGGEWTPHYNCRHTFVEHFD